MIHGGQKIRHLSLTNLGIIIPIAFLFWILFARKVAPLKTGEITSC